MSDRRYQAGIIAGIAKSQTAGGWPTEIKGLGKVSGGHPIARCVRCPPHAHPATYTTFVTYGGRPYCKACAVLEAKTAGAAA